MKRLVFAAAAVVARVTVSAHAGDDEPSIDVYSARGVSSDVALCSAFIDDSGIKIERTENSPAAILSKLENEGADSPADAVLLNHAAQLAAAESKHLFKPIASEVLAQRFPSHCAPRLRPMAASRSLVLPRAHRSH